MSRVWARSPSAGMTRSRAGQPAETLTAPHPGSPQAGKLSASRATHSSLGRGQGAYLHRDGDRIIRDPIIDQRELKQRHHRLASAVARYRTVPPRCAAPPRGAPFPRRLQWKPLGGAATGWHRHRHRPAQGPHSGSTRRARNGDFYLAISGDFSMATDIQSNSPGPDLHRRSWLTSPIHCWRAAISIQDVVGCYWGRRGGADDHNALGQGAVSSRKPSAMSSSAAVSPFDLPSPTLVLRVLQRRALGPRGAVGSGEPGTELAWLGNPLLLGRSAAPWDTGSRSAYGRR